MKALVILFLATAAHSAPVDNFPASISSNTLTAPVLDSQVLLTTGAISSGAFQDSRLTNTFTSSKTFIANTMVSSATLTVDGNTWSANFSTVALAAGNLFQIGASTNVDLAVTQFGHIETGGGRPGVTACGTSATIVGNDEAGKVTTQTTGVAACVLTFQQVWTNAPSCMVTNETTANLLRAVSTTSNVTLNGTTVAGDVLAYLCVGRQ